MAFKRSISKNYKNLSIKKKHIYRTPAFLGSPQKKGIVRRVRIVTPKKPNSARRPVAKVLFRTKERVTAHIYGRGHNLRSYSRVLVRGGGARDLPGCNYEVIRGVYDLMPTRGKRRRRSIHGLKKIGKRPRRKFRNV